jgi:hypothetical protein
MNQDFTFEEGVKVRWLLSEFHCDPVTDDSRFSLVGASEQIFTQSSSSVGQYMALQDMSFVSIVQRVLHYTDSRLHYGHPDLMLAEHVHFSSCGLSKASPEKNLSEGQTNTETRSSTTSQSEGSLAAAEAIRRSLPSLHSSLLPGTALLSFLQICFWAQTAGFAV